MAWRKFATVFFHGIMVEREPEFPKHRKPVALKIFECRIFCPFFSSGGEIQFSACWKQLRKPHIIALDEPTNYIDMETLDALVQGLARYKGGIIVARFLEETAGFWMITSKVWVCLCMIVVYGNDIGYYICILYTVHAVHMYMY